MDQHAFDDVGDVLRTLVPPELGELKVRAHRYGIKVWFDAEKAPREHYEAQVLSRKHVDDGHAVALEIGWHAEHSKLADNEAALARVRRAKVGKPAEAGVFYGADQWRRLSEVWFDFDLGDPDFAFEVASRLTEYIEAIEPTGRD